MEAPPHPSANARHPSLVLGTMGGPPNGDMVNGGGNPQATASGSKAAASSISELLAGSMFTLPNIML